MANILVLGGNFAGLTAALETKRHLKDTGHTVTVISARDYFLFVPSLIWVPFSEREIKDITVPVEPILRKRGIDFVHATATRINQYENYVETTAGRFDYDYLVIATGPKMDYSISGVGPDNGYTACICDPDGALDTRARFEKLIDNPGPVVIGATQAAGCVGAAYEFLFNTEFNLRKRGVRKKTEITCITPEPFVGHFGIEGITGGNTMLRKMFGSLDINFITNSKVDHVSEDEITLDDGRKLPFAFSMLMPAFLGQDVVSNSPGLGNAKGYVPVNAAYQHKEFPNIFAAGIAVDVPAPFTTPVPLGVPKTGFPADEEAKIVAHNITNLVNARLDLKVKEFGNIPGVCILDAGHKEVYLVANHLFKPRQFAALIPNPVYDGGKRALEKYFLWKTRNGLSYLT